MANHVLESINGQEVENLFYHIEDEQESNKTFRDLSLIMKHFEFVLGTYNKNLKVIEEFVYEIMTSSDKPIEML